MIARPLSAIERAILAVDRGAPLVFAIVVDVRGPLDEPALRVALDAVQRRHPLLGVAIDTEGARFVPGAPPIPLRVVQGGDDAWRAEADREVNAAFDLSGPLLRAVLVQRGDERAHLLLVLHHVVGDGRSGVLLARDVVTFAARALRGEAIDAAPIDPGAAIDERLPRLGFFRTLLGLIRILVAELWLQVRFGRPFRIGRRVPPFERRARVVDRVLEPDLVRALEERARSEQTTLHGALSASLLLSLLAIGNVRRTTRVLFGSPVDVRAAIHPPAGDAVGFFVSMVGFRGAIDPAAQLWQVARTIRDALARDLAQGGAVLGLRLLVDVVRMLGGARDPKKLAEKADRTMASSTGITNLGRLVFATDHPPLSIAALHVAASPSSLGDVFATVTTLHDRLYLNLVFAEPTLDEATAHRLADDTVLRLQRALL